LKAFLSYSTKDRLLAGRVKQRITYWGIDVFLAHEDIKPSKEWQDEIIRNLRGCSVFIPLLTKHFGQSEWTDQESGMALIESKIVIPLSVKNVRPYGFLARYQASKLRVKALDRSCEELLLAMRNNNKLRKNVQDSFIQSFLRSGSYDEANAKSKLVERLGPYNKRQVNEIIEGSIINSQIYDGFTANPKIRQFFALNRKLVDRHLRKKFIAQFGAAN